MSKLKNKLSSYLGNQLGNQIYAQLEHKLWTQLWRHFELLQLWLQLKRNLDAQIHESLLDL